MYPIGPRLVLSVVLLAGLGSPIRAQLFGWPREMLPPTAGPSHSAAHGDVDGDGDLDVFVFGASLSGDARGVLLLNDGTGRFEDATDQVPPLDSRTRAGALGDVDGDGDLDAYVVRDIDHGQLFLNDGSGVFTEASEQLDILPPGGEPVAAELCDLDGDGDLDAITVQKANFNQQPNRSTVMWNDGHGTFTWAKLQLRPARSADVAVGDVDGNGYLDFLLVNDGLNYLYTDAGAGEFAHERTALSADYEDSTGAALADVDVDGDLDALVVNRIGSGAQGSSRLFFNDGRADYTEAPAALPGDLELPGRVVLSDLDSDGDPDAVTGDAPRAFLNDGAGVFTEAEGFPELRRRVEQVVDFDADGDDDLDLFVANREAHDDLFLGNGAGAFEYAGGAMPLDRAIRPRFALSDVDGDRDLDALVVGRAHPRLLRNDGTGKFVVGQVVACSVDTESVACGDLDGDGDPDAFVGGLGTSYVLENEGGWFSSHESHGSANASWYWDVALGDVDADGALDVLVAAYGPAVLLLNDCDGEFGFTDASDQLPGYTERSSAALLADWNGDGSEDAFLGARFAISQRLYLNDGTGTFALGSLPDGASGVLAADAGDVDGDGDLDLAVAARGGPDRLYRNDGAATFELVEIEPSADSYWTRAISFSDVDGDGDLDLIGDYLALNDGAGEFSDGSALWPATSESWSLNSADLDGDGDRDLLVGKKDFEQDLVFFNLSRQLAATSLPRVGKPLTLALFGPEHSPWALARARSTTDVLLPGLGALRLEPATLAFVARGTLDHRGRDALSVQVPADPALVGIAVFLQAAVGFEPKLTNLEIVELTDF